MKKAILTIVLLYGISLTSYAQLGIPSTNAKDTLYIRSVYYNGTVLNKADWPDSIIVEDALNVYVANYVYVKGKLKRSTWAGENQYDATCGGRTAPMTIKQHERYTIGDYIFLVKKEDSNASTVNQNALYDGSMQTETTSGNSVSLIGRTAVSLPTPSFQSNVQGKIVVKIWVDRSGKVIKAEGPTQGSTLANPSIVNAAKAAALNAIFSPDENAPEEQVGSITYIFKL